MSGEKKPKAGDFVLGCAHEPDPGVAHYFHSPSGVRHRLLPAGKVAHFLLACEACFVTYSGRMNECPFPVACEWTEALVQAVTIECPS